MRQREANAGQDCSQPKQCLSFIKQVESNKSIIRPPA